MGLKETAEKWVGAFRGDSWQNLLTGLGTIWDKQKWLTPGAASFLTSDTLDALFTNDPLARRIVEDPVTAAFRQGFDVTYGGTWVDVGGRWEWYEPTPEDRARTISDIEQSLSTLGALDALVRLFVFGRLFGRSAILLGADDGRPLDQPLDEENVRELRYLELLDRRDYSADGFYSDPLQPNYGLPETWRVQRGGTYSTTIVHASRMLHAGGAMISQSLKSSNQWSDASVLDGCINELQRFNSDNLSVSHMMTDSSQGVLKINGFCNILSGGDKDTLRTRMDIIDRGRSVSRIMPIDAEGEEFAYIERGFVGIPEILEQRQQILAGAVGWPVVMLFGREPAGLNATGEADIRAWYDTVHADRSTIYQPIIERLVRLVARVVEADQPGAAGIEWPSLWQESPEEHAKRQNLTANTDAIYLSGGVVTASEVGVARFSSDVWSDKSVQIDTEKRDETQEIADEPEQSDADESADEAVIVAAASDVDVQATALNGAQISALTQYILLPVARGEIPRETAIETILLAFPSTDREQAERLLGPIGMGWEPPVPPPVIVQAAPDEPDPSDNASP